MKKFQSMLTVLIFAVSIMTGCAKKAQPVSKSTVLLDTVTTVTIYDGSSEKIIDGAFELCEDYENLISATIPTSDIGRINAAKGEAVEVSDDTISILKKAIEYSELSDGAFDITIYPVSKLWDFRTGKKEIPDADAIKEALKHVDYHNIEIDGNNVRMKDSEAEIDPGGIGKGYIADKMKEYMMSKGVKSAIINLGGNVLTIGKNPNGNPFKIGIQKPFGEPQEVLTAFEAEDLSIVSSGNYERYFIKDNKIYHHILDTKTGYPVESGLNGVTVITEESVDGDALSTSCFALGEEKGAELLSKLKGTVKEAIFVDTDNQITKVE